MPPSAEAITALLQAWSRGDADAANRLLPLVYGELHQRAARYLRRERPGHTLQPTELVHEAYLRLVGHNVAWRNRSQFFGVASNVMRRVLVDHARRRRAAKRAAVRALDEVLDVAAAHGVDVVQLDQALSELSAIDPRQGRIVELRFFGGLTLDETAETLAISAATVKRDWNMGRAWLFRRLEGMPAADADDRPDDV